MPILAFYREVWVKVADASSPDRLAGLRGEVGNRSESVGCQQSELRLTISAWKWSLI